MTNINVNEISWHAERGDNTQWIAFCPALGIITEADSLDELHSLIPEAINLLLIDLLEEGDLHDFLHEKGWKSSKPIIDASNPDEFDLPWNLIAEGRSDKKRAFA